MLKIIKRIVAMLAVITAFYPWTGYGADHPVDYQIQGLNLSLIAPVKTRLNDSLQALTPPLNSEAIRGWYQRSSAEIQRTLFLYGFFTPTIHAKLLYQNKTWHALYQISSGQLSTITSLKIAVQGEGTRSTALKKLIAELPLHQGDGFISERYEQAKQKLLTAAIADGYLSAHFTTRQVLINRQAHTAQVTLILDTGSRYYFGPVTFQQAILKDSFLRRYIPFKVGDPYSSEQLLKLQDSLNDSGYFQGISIIDLETKKQTQQVPVTFQLTPQASQRYTAGIGYSTDVGVKATLGWESRYLNQSGHKLSVISQLSQIQNGLQATYTIPGTHPDTDSSRLNFAIVRKQLPQVDSTTQQLGIASVKQWNNWQSNLFLNYQIEHFNYVDHSTVSSHLLTPGISFSRSQFDDPIYALRGYSLNIRLQGADKNILSSASFLQTQLQAKTIMSWNKTSRIIFRGTIGYTLTLSPDNFPPSLLFYAGGSQSIRGYDYQALGPGRYLLVGSAEYQHHLVNNFYGALFFDAGNAVNSFPITPQKGAGIGLVWVSPLGPLELTLGKALDLPGRPLRVQFSMGIDLL